MISIRITLCLAMVAMANAVMGQSFVWETGSTSYNAVPVYGTLGVPSPNNVPGARHNAALWTDSLNNIWMWGGEGISDLGNSCWHNDLWKFDPITKNWTWMDGSKRGNQSNYGLQGMPNPINLPPGRYGHAYWQDDAGNLWIFGGWGDWNGYRNDLWKYDIQTGEWTWMKGSQSMNATGTFGTKGVAAMSNEPGGRTYCGFWKDDQGRFWIHGGHGNAVSTIDGNLADTWMYDPATNMWTWMHGYNVVNTWEWSAGLGIPDTMNIPSSRDGGHFWKDLNGNFWMFGGLSSTDFEDDLWMFNPNTVMWTQVIASNTNHNGIFGNLGVPAPANRPGGRGGGTTWTDQVGDLWLFGGLGDAITTNDDLRNDVWKYNIQSGMWTWMYGDSVFNDPGVFGQQGVANPSNKLPSMFFSRAITDGNGLTWIFGGDRWSNLYNLLWSFNGGGINSAPVLSTLPAQTVCALDTAGPYTFTVTDNDTSSISLTGSSDNQNLVADADILISGTGGTWQIRIVPNPSQSGIANISLVAEDISGKKDTSAFSITVNPATSAQVSMSQDPGPYCAGDPVGFSAVPTNGGSNPSYQWTVNSVSVGANSPFFLSSSIQNGDLVAVSLNSNASCLSSPTASASTNASGINAIPTTPTISQIGSDSLMASTAGGDYQWFFNGLPIPNSNAQTIFAAQDGNYTVVVTQNGCSSEASSVFPFIFISVEAGVFVNRFAVFPNPASKQVFVEFQVEEAGPVKIEIFDMRGILVLQEDMGELGSGKWKESLDLTSLTAGNYLLRLRTSQGSASKHLILK